MVALESFCKKPDQLSLPDLRGISTGINLDSSRNPGLCGLVSISC
jgi:hypothetical protein